MRIALGADHAGVALKDQLKHVFDEAAPNDNTSHTYVDFGTHSDTSVDYPDFAQQVATAVASGSFDRGILVCGSGIGMSIAANKIPGVRAALVHNIDAARLCREHTDANIVTLAGRSLDPKKAHEIVRTFLDTPFIGGRHKRRVDRITAIERQPDEASDG